MMIGFKTLFSLAVTHDYYGGACGDVGFVMPQDVAQLMRGAGLLAKTIDGALHVFYRIAGAGAPPRSAAGRTVRIGLQVQSPAFANITEGFDPGAGALYYRNGAAAVALDAPTRVALGGRLISWPLSRAVRPVMVTVMDAAGRALRTDKVTAENDRPLVSFDLTGVEPGALTLKEVFANGVPPGTTATYYVEPELWREGVLGLVEIVIAPTFYESAPSFTVAFQARRETLRYYVVAKGFSNGDVDQLTVRDQGFGEPGHSEEVKFEKVPPEKLNADEKSKTALLGGDGARVLLFRSLSAITRRQGGMKRIQLLRNNDPLIENLPQPGRDRGTADLVVHLSKSKA
jgi:hypothetical protein